MYCIMTFFRTQSFAHKNNLYKRRNFRFQTPSNTFSTTLTATVSPRLMSTKIDLSNGMRIGYQEFGAGNAKKILALHGWLDNSNSFAYLGPKLAAAGFHVLAVDHIGHGLSSHLPISANYQFARYATTIKEILDIKNWERPCLVGHSLGGALSYFFAGVYPERVEAIVSIDIFGGLTQPASMTRNTIRKAIDAEIKSTAKILQSTGPKSYASVNTAIEARIRILQTYPGKQSISREAASMLIARGVFLTCDPSSDVDVIEEGQGPVSFRHDIRLQNPSYSYFTPDQAMNIYEGISCKCMALMGENGWPLNNKDIAATKKLLLESKGLLTFVTMPGSHHLHLDPETASETANVILQFLNAHATETAALYK